MSLLHCSVIYSEVLEFTRQARSLPSHSTWQGLKPSDPLTLLTGDNRPEILWGEDTEGLTYGVGTKFSANSVVPGNSSDIHGVLQF